MHTPVRVRFAPSPTGPLHIGGLRTALYNYLFARQNGGTFILRIEDTDQKRLVPQSEEYIFESLSWSGLVPDEAPHRGGDHGPYRQSERSHIYPDYVQQLLTNNHAYYAFDTPEELDAYRQQAEARGETFSYGPANRDRLHNSLRLSPDEVQARLQNGKPYVVRFRTPADRAVNCPDLVRGEVVYQSALLDDKVLFKSDGLPTYHLANVVDDHLMQISHVIRGEEWLPSLPLHVLLYEAFGWEPPVFAHLPLILKPSGPGKLSKRDALLGDFPIFPLQWEDNPGFRERGFLPSALRNILALLGWNAGTDQEIFSLEELIASFDLSRVQKSGARFDPEKNAWFNQQHLHQLEVAELARLIADHPGNYGVPADWINREAYFSQALSLVKERCSLLTDLPGELRLFFEAPAELDAKALKKAWKEPTAELLTSFVDGLGPALDAEELKALAKQVTEDRGLGLGALMAPLRLSLVGSLSGPDLYAVISLLGTEETARRVRNAIQMA